MRRAPVKLSKHSRPAKPTIITYSNLAEERLAAIASHYTWSEYQDLPGDDDWVGLTGSDSKAMVIATYRAKLQIQREHGA